MYCTALYYIVLLNTVLYSTLPWVSRLSVCFIALHPAPGHANAHVAIIITALYTLLHCSTALYTLLHYSTELYTILHCSTSLYTLIHCGTSLYTLLHCRTALYILLLCCKELYTLLRCCTALHYTALHFCSALLHRFTVLYSVAQYSKVQYSTVLYTVAQYSEVKWSLQCELGQCAVTLNNKQNAVRHGCFVLDSVYSTVQ